MIIPMKNFCLSAKPLSLSAKLVKKEKKNKLRKQLSSHRHLKYITNIDIIK